MNHSKSILSAVAVASAMFGVGAASAADLPARTYTKAPVMMETAYSWTGFYIGGNVGGAWGNTDYTTTNTPGGAGLPGIFGVGANIALVNALGTGSVNSNNGQFTGGFQAGYNWQ